MGANKDLKRGGKLSQGVGALKRGSWNPLMNYGNGMHHEKLAFFVPVIRASERIRINKHKHFKKNKLARR